MNKKCKIIKRVLFDREISQTKMASDLEISLSHLNRILNGWIIPKGKIREKICQYLEVDETAIFKDLPENEKAH